MPLRNRVTPRGDLIATPARGLFMGNRGRLHDGDRRIVRHANSNLWIVCLLDFRGRHREVMSPHSYTELFFLDDAVALSAGHRPCAECRHAAYRDYLDAVGLDGAPELNETLRASRRAPRAVADVTDLPDGVFVEADDGPRLKWLGALHLWTPRGYADPLPAVGTMQVITSDLSITALRNGFRPVVHPTVEP